MERISRSLRAAARLALYGAVTLLFYLLWLLGMPVALLHRGARTAWRRFWFRGWARVVTPILGVRLTIEGTPPDPPFLLVSNHLGYLDIILFASQLKARFVAKREVGSWPLLGPLVRSMGTLFVDRTSRKDLLRVNDRIEQLLREQEGIVLFPEGTSSGGAEVLDFKPSLLDAAARNAIPVHPASIRYESRRGDPHASHAVCWWGDMTFFAHFIKLLGLRGVRSTLVFGDSPVQGTNRKQLAADLRNSVDELFRPMTTKEALCPTHLP